MLVARLMLAALLMMTGPALAGSVTVIDGDTFDLDGVRYSVHGIDAPEAGQRCASGKGGTWDCGAAAIAKLENLLLPASVVSCDTGTPDGYGRTVAICRADGVDVGQEMVADGLAWAFVKYSTDYLSVEAVARDARRGIWRAPTEPAWEFREIRWASFGSEAPDPTCPIKGNISNKGERIYHPPWSPVYSRTKISPEKGERWFCDEGEAVAAGWRQAYWGRRNDGG